MIAKLQSHETPQGDFRTQFRIQPAPKAKRVGPF